MTIRLNLLLRALVLCVVFALVGTSSVVAQTEDELESEIAEAKAAREEAQAKAAEAAGRIDLATAEAEEIRVVLEAMTESVESQRARVESVKLDLANARSFVRANRNRQDDIAKAIDRAIANAKLFAVDAFVGTSDSGEVWLESSDLVQSARKVSYLDVVNQDRDDSFDDLRQLRADQADATAAARRARAEEKVLKESVDAELAILQEREATQQLLLDEANRRLARWIAEQEDHIEEDEDLEKLIAAKQAELKKLREPPPPPPKNGWQRPVSGGVTSGFGVRTDPITGSKTQHNGVDFNGSTGSPIYAAADGEVIFAGWSSGGCGNTVAIAHGGGLTSRYCHQADGAIRVSVGTRVSMGDRIGGVGSTGRSTGPHLHFSISKNGVFIDPFVYIP